MGGANPAIYHLTNVILHAVTVVPGLPADRARRPRADGTGGRSALRCAPAQHAGCRLVQGATSCCSASSSWWRFSYVECGRTSRPAWLALHGVATALALFSKETAAIVPFGIGLHALLFRTMTTRAAIGVATSELVAGMVWWFMRSQALAGSSAVNATLPEALGQSWQILIYVGKLLAPLRLNVMPGPDIVTMGLGGGALLALGVGLAVARSLSSAPGLCARLGPALCRTKCACSGPAGLRASNALLMGAAIGLAGVLAPTTRAYGLASWSR